MGVFGDIVGGLAPIVGSAFGPAGTVGGTIAGPILSHYIPFRKGGVVFNRPIGSIPFKRGGIIKRQRKIRKVLREFEKGKLRSFTGKKVTKRKQALAIALNEARRI